MMELQTLQEALKVEIQVHQKLVAQMKQDPQNADLKKQLHELQAKITALSEKQKKVVEQLRKDLLVKQEPELKLQVQPTDTKHALQPPTSLPQSSLPPQSQGAPQKTLTVTPVITTKTLPLVLKAATSTMPASVAMQRPTVAMVTAISNAAKPSVNSDSQNTPINLQVASKLTNQGSDPARIVSKNVIVVQATTTTSTQPIKVPQFVPPPRLTPRPTFLPQVRPKPPTPNNVPIAPAPPPPMMAAPALLQRPVMLTTKLAASSLPPAAGSIHQVRIVNGQPCAALAKAQPVGQLTGIVISGPAQTLQISSLATDTKTVKSQGGTEKMLASVPSSSTPPLPPPSKSKREENPQKLAFMVSLGLVTHDHLEEIQSRRQERKRRTTANPVYSGAVFEPERKKTAVTYLNTPLHQGTRKRGRPPKYSSVPELGCHTPNSPSSCHPASPGPERPGPGSFPFPVHPHTLPLPSPSSGDGDIHEDFCTVCRRSGQLLMCDTCSRVYHLDCLDPPLKNIPKGMWICPKCQDQILKKEEAIPWPGTLAIVHSYIAYKEAKEEEKQKLMKWSAELKLEREQLEQRVKQLSSSITKCMETKNTILARQKEMQTSLGKVKHLVRLIQTFNLSQTLEEQTPLALTEGTAKVSAEIVPEVSAHPVAEEKAEQMAEEQIEPLVVEKTEPVAEEKVEPMVVEKAKPMVMEEAEPMAEEKAEPVAKEKVDPMSKAQTEPIIVEKTEPVVMEKAEPMDVEKAEPIVGEKAEPVLVEKSKPIFGENAEPVTEEKAEPVAIVQAESSAEPGLGVDTEPMTVVKTVEPVEVTANGNTDCACTGTSKDESSASDTSSVNTKNATPTTNSTEEAMETEEDTEESVNNGSSTNNGKTSEPSQHPLPAPLDNLDDAK